MGVFHMRVLSTGGTKKRLVALEIAGLLNGNLTVRLQDTHGLDVKSADQLLADLFEVFRFLRLSTITLKLSNLEVIGKSIAGSLRRAGSLKVQSSGGSSVTPTE